VSEHADPRVTTVVRLLDAYRVGNLQSMQQWMSFDVTLEAVGNNPLAGVYSGLGGVLAFIGRSTATFAPNSVKIEDIYPQGDEVHVIVAADVLLLDGRSEGVRILQRYWFGKDGKVVRIQAEAADDPEEFDRLIEEAHRT